MLAILDYEAGNQTSVRRALDFLGIPCSITADPDVLLGAAGVIFPGVGAAGQAMEELHSKGLDRVLGEVVRTGKPLLGICVGCQILLDYSAENDTSTLGILSGECRRFDPSWTDESGRNLIIPHMGWNGFQRKKECSLLDNVPDEAEFYFVHSYFPVPAPELVLATTFYGREFASLFGRPGLWATQFHPEKSGRPGLTLLANFYAYCNEVAHAQ
ncbi:imidazole glycerol phosphate synthase subunit hisH [Desulfonatronum thiosulfatophilum]|uniref:Imidazole glycerol phosphate synthase subunit HisH n=1 Tax=Desulfonatronum thiosulfatophilum TaxID=617002 RepID=A0A1G6B227_9BACT|nr:imidazole glycerol phosphate synthase subunit HisH [Desulfonatronum thiosulfatophilum]SDB14718.1 imidazole glycerol phosphate synthase subunit hisH [Desulfonatronum thiosulfatophilum]